MSDTKTVVLCGRDIEVAGMKLCGTLFENAFATFEWTEEQARDAIGVLLRGGYNEVADRIAKSVFSQSAAKVLGVTETSPDSETEDEDNKMVCWEVGCSADGNEICNTCEDRMCDAHCYDCSECGEYLCSLHHEVCEGCGEGFCREHRCEHDCS